MFKVYIDGQIGTTGLRIASRLANRSDIELLKIKEELRKDINERKKLLNNCDIAILCLPDQASIEAVSLIDNENVKVIDASTAHRTNSSWVYGFPELSKKHLEKIKNSKRVCVPGCHASGFIALVYPLIESGVIDRDYYLSTFSLTGYSGGGIKMINEYNEAKDIISSELHSPRIYGLNQTHKHLPEIVYVLDLVRPPVFQPIVCDYYAGMVVSIPLEKELLKKKLSLEELKNLYTLYYKGQKIISVNNDTELTFLGSNNLNGKDSLEIFINGNDERMTISSRFDNLGKGASGAAIQCMNIMLGVEQITGLILD